MWFRQFDGQCFFWMNTYLSTDGSEYGYCDIEDEEINLLFANN